MSKSKIEAHPIIFSGPMVRAILEGRKTQTRRVVRNADHFACLTGDCPHELQLECDRFMGAACPFGAPRNTLWVREAYFFNDVKYDRGPIPKTRPLDFELANICYRADGELNEQFEMVEGSSPWRPSIFMPRWASRISLRVVSVRVERLQDISADDACAEGIDDHDDAPEHIYRVLWDSINAKRAPWSSNPWVWVVSFERIEGGVS